jgi:uncharacterized protein
MKGVRIMRIGVISDTHSYLNPRVLEIFRNVDMILHAGDVGSMDVLTDLAVIGKPVKAVYGNTDDFDIRRIIPEKRIIDTGFFRIGLAHGGGSPYDIIERLHNSFINEDVKIIVFGHTHNFEQKPYNNILMFNPGYGRKTIGLIEINDTGDFKTRILNL